MTLVSIYHTHGGRGLHLAFSSYIYIYVSAPNLMARVGFLACDPYQARHSMSSAIAETVLPSLIESPRIPPRCAYQSLVATMNTAKSWWTYSAIHIRAWGVGVRLGVGVLADRRSVAWCSRKALKSVP